MTQTQRQIASDYRYLEDYSYARKPASQAEDFDSVSWEEDFGGEIPGSPDASEYEDGATPATHLNAIQQRVQGSGLSPEQQQRILDELNALAAMPGGANFEDELGEFEAKLDDTIENRGNLNESEELVKKLKADISENKDLTDRERKDALKRIEAFEKELSEDPGLQAKEELGDLLAVSEEHALRLEAREAEAKRTEGTGQQIAAALDQVFQAPASPQDSDRPDWKGYVAGALVGGTLGAAIGASSVTLGTIAISALGGPIAWGVAGTVIGATVLFGETDAPRSKLNNLPESFQKLDLAMHGESGLEKSPAAGNVIRALYDTKLSAKEQSEAIEKAVASLPLPSQAYVLSLAVQAVAENDPKKLDYLKENTPEVLSSIRKTIQDGEKHVKEGMLANTGHDDYDVGFNGLDYQISNQDTAWYRNDWNGFGIPMGELTSPLADGLRHLDGLSDLPDSSNPGSAPQPEPSSAEV